MIRSNSCVYILYAIVAFLCDQWGPVICGFSEKIDRSMPNFDVLLLLETYEHIFECHIFGRRKRPLLWI